MSDTSETFELIVVEGRRKWLCSNGKILPYVAGGAGGNEPDPTPKPPDPKPGDPPPKTFTQEEVNAIISKRLEGARNTTTTELMKELGITDTEEAKRLLKAARDAEEANATELDKARKAADEAKTKEAATAAELASTKLTTAIVEALVDGGLTLSAAKKVRAMITIDKIDEESIKAAVADLKKEMPVLFEPAGAGGPPAHNPGGAPPGGGGKPNDPQAVATRTLYERHPELKKTS